MRRDPRDEAGDRVLRTLVDASPVPIIVIESDATVRLWNPAATRVFGWSADEVVGRPIPIVPPDRIAECAGVRQTLVDGNVLTAIETHRRRKDGTQVELTMSAAPLADPDGVVRSMVLLFEDVTQRKDAEAKRAEALAVAERARAEAEAANVAKDHFLAMLSHELRNPLSAIRNAIVTARLDGTRRERALEIAGRQTDQLTRILDDLLDVSRISQGHLALRTERLYLARVVERAVETTRGLMDERGHVLRVSLPDDVIEIEADPSRIEQVLVNLLTNAAKYTEPGGRIELIVQRDDADVAVIVRDNGIGITSDVLPRVFDLFVRAENASNRSQGGLGIGLTLVRRLVELHGGRVDASSDGPGTGAAFVVRLPALAAAAAGRAASSDVVGARRARVVLVEDNPDAAESLLMLLELLGHHVQVFGDGVSALAAAAATPPDVMIVDIGLPGIDGYEVARRARRDPRLARIVLVALTGYGREEDKRDALAAGFDRHLVKPVEPGAIEGLVAHLARSSRATPAFH